MGLHLFASALFLFKCRNSHRSIAKVRIIDSNNINGGQKAKIRCKCLAVSSGLEIASLLYSISEQCCSHRLWLEGFHQTSPSSPNFSISFFLSDISLDHISLRLSSSSVPLSLLQPRFGNQYSLHKTGPIKRCGFAPRHAWLPRPFYKKNKGMNMVDF